MPHVSQPDSNNDTWNECGGDQYLWASYIYGDQEPHYPVPARRGYEHYSGNDTTALVIGDDYIIYMWRIGMSEFEADKLYLDLTTGEYDAYQGDNDWV